MVNVRHLQATCDPRFIKQAGSDQEYKTWSGKVQQQERNRNGKNCPERTRNTHEGPDNHHKLPDPISMHDSGSSLKDVIANKEKLQEGLHIDQSRVPDSVDTKPVEE